MNATSAALPPDVDEMQLAKLESAPSRLVKPPRVAASPAALECQLWKTIPIPGRSSRPYTMVIGEVIGIYIADGLIQNGLVDTVAMQPIARMGYMDYAVVDGKFTLKRPR
jgi:flavin reductase (DIM6/NTAB) family NADH-FMN oxidoreductase RutF